MVRIYYFLGRFCFYPRCYTDLLFIRHVHMADWVTVVSDSELQVELKIVKLLFGIIRCDSSFTVLQ